MKFDARKLSTLEQTSLRKHAVQLVLSGQSPHKVTRLLGLGDKTIYRWLRDNKQNGMKALEPKKRTGRARTLDEKKSKDLIHCILHQNPMHFGFNSLFWTRSIISELINIKHNIPVGLTSVSHLLNRYGIYPQRLINDVYADEKYNVSVWIKQDYSKIKILARKHRAMILWLDSIDTLMPDVLDYSLNNANCDSLHPHDEKRFILLTQHRGGFVLQPYSDKNALSHLLNYLNTISSILDRPIYVISNNNYSFSLINQNNSKHSENNSVFIHELPVNDNNST